MDEGSGWNSSLDSARSHTDGYDAYSSEIPDAERYVETAILSVITLVAAASNGSLWLVVLSSRALRRQSSMLLLLCVSLADLLVACVSMPITVVTIALARWVYGETTCTVMGFLNMLTLVSSVMSLGLISINRYVKICQPHHYRRLFTLPRVFLMTSGVWCLSAMLSSPPLLGWCRYDYLPRQSFCFSRWSASISYTFFMVVVCFCGPLSMMTICGVQILKTFRKSQQQLCQSHKVSTLPVNPKLDHKSPSLEKPVRITAVSSAKDKPTFSPDKRLPSSMSVHRHPAEGCMEGGATEAVPTSPSVPAGFKPTEADMQVDSVAVPMPSSVPVHLKPAETCMQDESEEAVPDEKVAILRPTSTALSREPSPEPGTSASSSELPENTNSSSLHVKHGVSEPSVSVKNSTASPALSPSRLIIQQRQKEKKRMEEFQLALSLMVVVVVFVICWLPFCITIFISVFMPSALPRPADMFTLLLGYSNSCINPVIYGIRNKQVKEGYRSLWAAICSCCMATGRRQNRIAGRTRRASLCISKSSP